MSTVVQTEIKKTRRLLESCLETLGQRGGSEDNICSLDKALVLVKRACVVLADIDRSLEKNN